MKSPSPAEPLSAPDLERLAWPRARAAEAVEALARASGMLSGRRPRRAPREASRGDGRLGSDLEHAARRYDLEVEPVSTAWGDAGPMLQRCGPALLEVATSSGGGLLLVLGPQWGRMRLLGPDHRLHRVSIRSLAATARRHTAEPWAEAIEPLLDRLGLSPRRGARAREALLEERLGQVQLRGCWLLRLAPGSSFRRQLRRAHLDRLLAGFLGSYATGFALLLVSWWVLGRGALAGSLPGGWVWAWALVLATLLPIRLVSLWAQARLTAGLGALLKRRLLDGALRLEPEEIRHQGAGQLLGRVIESESVEFYALQGGFLSLAGGIDLLLSILVLSRGAGGWPHALLAAGWGGGFLAIAWRYYRERARWTDERLALTHDVVEGLVGHRTRLVQERPERWHDDEDRHLERYLDASRRLDHGHLLLLSLIPRGWLALGFAAVVPAFVLGSSSVAGLALGVGGVLGAYRGFAKLSEGLGHLAGAAIGWQQAAEVFRASRRRFPAAAIPGEDDPVRAGSSPLGQRSLLEAQNLVYRHPGRPAPALRRGTLRAAPGERILLEGPSGGGKSTLAAVLSGLREPQAGLLLLGGLDRHSLGAEAWRRRVVLSPQFHENHVFSETLAFNLLMGRRWPPEPEDLEEALEVCQELGLGNLLERMPAGLQQLVGDTGWQLSHGEQGRLFIARALLQRAEVVILDEAFAALDPESLQEVIACVVRRAPTLLAIGHP